MRVAGCDFGETKLRAVGQQSVDRADVAHHVSVPDRSGSRAVVARHASDGGAARSSDIDREEQSVWLEERVEHVQNQAWLHRSRPRVGIEGHDGGEVLARVEDESLTEYLAALRRSRPSRHDGHSMLGRDLK